MKTDKLIRISELCSHYQIERSFFDEIEYYELIEIHIGSTEKFIHQKHLSRLEKIIRLRDELEINMQGIDVVLEMMSKIKKLKRELKQVQIKLSFYENDGEDF